MNDNDNLVLIEYSVYEREIMENKMLIQELRDTIDNQRETIDRLNNIINELERYITSNYEYYTGVNDVSLAKKLVYKDLLDKLKELKENK